ncbi:MAG: D-alanyl-D-alanine carboxypeptidase [Clostridia bacterium]|nr:D-alanyl-D-alanine carboxypeptidase [Clostridia bacterium]
MNLFRKYFLTVLISVAIITNFNLFAYAEKSPPPVEIKAKSAVLMDAATGKILMKFNENEKVYPASVTKIMPLLLITEAIDSGKIALSDVVTVSANAASKGGSQIWLKEGEQMTVDDLLKATAVYSANDACTALGDYLAGSDEAFVKLLNERAAELGMTNTHFENCTGLDDETVNHLTTALDVAVMSRELLKHELITNYTTIWMDSLRDGQTELVNTNKLVRFYEGTTGLKTGTTSKAGCCVSASAMRDGTHLIAVVMGSENSSDRFESAKAMLNWGFANFSTVTPEIDASLIPNVGVINGVVDFLTPKVPEPDSFLIEKGREGEITQTIDVAVDVVAPVEQGQVLGTVTFRLADEVLGEYKITAPDTIEPLTFGILFMRIIGTFAK